MMEPATIRYSNENHVARETVPGGKLRNSPSAAATSDSRIPPASIWAPELMTFDEGRGSLRVSTDAIDQLTEPMIRAIAPEVSIGAPPRFNERLMSTATPASPTKSAVARQTVSRWVRR